MDNFTFLILGGSLAYHLLNSFFEINVLELMGIKKIMRRGRTLIRKRTIERREPKRRKRKAAKKQKKDNKKDNKKDTEKDKDKDKDTEEDKKKKSKKRKKRKKIPQERDANKKSDILKGLNTLI